MIISYILRLKISLHRFKESVEELKFTKVFFLVYLAFRIRYFLQTLFE